MKHAFLLLATLTIMVIAFCGCDKIKDKNNKLENFLGGDGRFSLLSDGTGRVGSEFQDDKYVYIGFETLQRINKETKTVTIACLVPGCTHDTPGCKANLKNVKYRVFNGRLIKVVNDAVLNNDGSYTNYGKIYLCDNNEKLVYENKIPEDLDEDLAKKTDCGINDIRVLGDYIALRNSFYTYYLDKYFNVKFTAFDVGSSNDSFYANGEIYYIDSLYRLVKINKENSEHSVINLCGMKATEGAADSKRIWFSNENFTLCSYDIQTGEIKEYAEKAVQLRYIGKYIEYYHTGNVCVLDTKSGETFKWNDIDINRDDFMYFDGNYYTFNTLNSELVQYSEDLKSVVNNYALVD